MTHDSVCRLVLQRFAHEQAVIGEIEMIDGLSGANRAVDQRLDHTEVHESEECEAIRRVFICWGEERLKSEHSIHDLSLFTADASRQQPDLIDVRSSEPRRGCPS